MMVVLLGFADVEVKETDSVDWTSNKVAGLPDWFASVNIDQYPQCGLCTANLYHLVQMYCPLLNSTFHRTLNVFGCINKTCWNKSQSIVVMRSQELEVKTATKVKTQERVSCDDWGGASTWCDGDDDWGNVDDDNHTNIQDSIGGFAQDESSDGDGITDELNELSITDNNNICHNNPCLDGVHHFMGYHIYVHEESVTSLLGSNEYEMKLYEDYIKREGDVMTDNIEDNNNDNDKSKSKGNKGKKGAMEKYEKTRSKSTDEAFHQFKKRISTYPQQLLRYEWCGDPLLLSSRSPLDPPSLHNIPPCPYCTAPRVFECQLLPSLLNYLHTNTSTHSSDQNTQLGNETIEFGCIYVFTCSNACWDTCDVKLEYVVLQPDPDVDVLK